MLKWNHSAFALDNDGFRYALAKAMGATLKRFEIDAENSWKISSDAVIEIVKRVKEMDPYPTEKITDLNKSYEAVSKMCRVSFHFDIKVEFSNYIIKSKRITNDCNIS